MPRGRTGIRPYKPVLKESPLARHRAMLMETQTASDLVGAGLCPNDGNALAHGECSRCRFRLTIGAPPVIPIRATFNRRWTKSQAANRRYY